MLVIISALKVSISALRMALAHFEIHGYFILSSVLKNSS
jgi:hypothetical protein